MPAIVSAIGKILASSGIRNAFGVVGGGNILAVAGLTAAGIRYIPTRHEGGAMSAADAYYRVTGEVALCTTSHGPGLTNIATGLAEAVKHGSGVLVLCGDAPVDRLRPNDIDQTAFAGAVGAQVVRITSPSTALVSVASALQLARTDRCPVVLCLPSDMGSLEVRAADPGPVTVAAPADRKQGSGTEIGAVLDLLATARHPLLVAGLGAWYSGAAKAIAELGDRLGALLATTVMASNLFADSAWSLGIIGGFAPPRAAEIIRAADVIIAFGSRLDPFTLHHGKLISPQATVVQVDVTDAPKADRIDLTVTADATAAATALLDGVNERRLASSPWRVQLAGQLEHMDWSHVPYDDAGTVDRIDPRTLALALADLLPEERTVVLDGGHFIAWPSMYWRVPDPAGLAFTGAAFQAIGLGFAGGVGAAAGRPDRLTVIALGDGGALMGLPELETLIRSRLSALVVIFDDAAYGFEVHMYGPLGADLDAAAFKDTDFAGIARSLGAAAATVRTVADLAAVRAWYAQDRPGTLVLDCKVVRDVIAGFLSDIIGVTDVNSARPAQPTTVDSRE